MASFSNGQITLFNLPDSPNDRPITISQRIDNIRIGGFDAITTGTGMIMPIPCQINSEKNVKGMWENPSRYGYGWYHISMAAHHI